MGRSDGEPDFGDLGQGGRGDGQVPHPGTSTAARSPGSAGPAGGASPKKYCGATPKTRARLSIGRIVGFVLLPIRSFWIALAESPDRPSPARAPIASEAS